MPIYYSLFNEFILSRLFYLFMGQIQILQEIFSVFHLLLLCFSPLLPFLYFELVSKFLKKDDDDNDDDSDSGINALAFQA